MGKSFPKVISLLLFVMIVIIYAHIFAVDSYAQVPEFESYNNRVAGIEMRYPSEWILGRELGNGMQLVYSRTQQLGDTIFSIAAYRSNITEQQFDSIDEVRTAQEYANFINMISPSQYAINSTANSLDPAASPLPQQRGSLEILNHTKTRAIFDGKLSHIFEIQYEDPFTQPITAMIIYTDYDDGIYQTTYNSPSSEYSQHLQTINAIIDSIKLQGISESPSSSLATAYSMLMGIRLQFPADWGVFLNDLSNPQMLVLTILEQIGSTSSPVGDVTLAIFPNQIGVTVEELPDFVEQVVKSTVPEQTLGDIYYTGLRPYMLNGHMWYEYEYRYAYQDPLNDFNNVARGLITIKDDRAYFLTYTALNNKFEDHAPQFEQIANSLNFTESPLQLNRQTG